MTRGGVGLDPFERTAGEQRVSIDRQRRYRRKQAAVGLCCGWDDHRRECGVDLRRFDVETNEPGHGTKLAVDRRGVNSAGNVEVVAVRDDGGDATANIGTPLEIDLACESIDTKEIHDTAGPKGERFGDFGGFVDGETAAHVEVFAVQRQRTDAVGSQ